MAKTKDKKDKELAPEILNPIREAFIISYTDPKSPTYGNALQSALKAGFSREYAESLLYKKPLWLSEIVGRSERLEKARRNMDKFLELKTAEPLFQDGGKPIVDPETGEIVTKENPRLLEIQQKATFVVLKTHDKDFEEKADNKSLLNAESIGKIEIHYHVPEQPTEQQPDVIEVQSQVVKPIEPVKTAIPVNISEPEVDPVAEFFDKHQK